MAMGIIDKMREHDYEQVVFCNHKLSGLRAIIVISRYHTRAGKSAARACGHIKQKKKQ